MSEYRGQRIMSHALQGPFRPVADEETERAREQSPEPAHDDLGGIVPAPTAEALNTELLEACELGDTDTVTRILDLGLDVDARDTRGNTALMVACRNCQIDVVKILLERGANIHAKNSYSREAMDVASDWGYPSIIALLRACGSEDSPPRFSEQTVTRGRGHGESQD
jgi:ankyrin repeat protein